MIHLVLLHWFSKIIEIEIDKAPEGVHHRSLFFFENHEVSN
jgi:hypothetical protein